MPNSDNTYGTYNKKTKIFSQVSTPLTVFANIDAAKSHFFTTEALAVWNECCTTLSWALVADGNGDNTKLKVTYNFGTKGGNIVEADDWAGQFTNRLNALRTTPLKSFDISGAVQDGSTWEVTVTAAGHTFEAGDTVSFTGVQGMTQLNSTDDLLGLKVLSVAGNNLVVEATASSFSAYTSGGKIESTYERQWVNGIPNITEEDSTDHLF